MPVSIFHIWGLDWGCFHIRIHLFILPGNAADIGRDLALCGNRLDYHIGIVLITVSSLTQCTELVG